MDRRVPPRNRRASWNFNPFCAGFNLVLSGSFKAVAYIYNFLKWLRTLSGAEMEIYIYFTDPNTKFIQTAKTSAFKWDILYSKEEME